MLGGQQDTRYRHLAGTGEGAALGLWWVSSSYPSCHHQPVVRGALVLSTAEQDRKRNWRPIIPHVLFLTLTEQIPNFPPFAG